MDATNNFKRLAAEDEEQTPHAPERVEQQVMGTVKTGQLMGNVLELYFSKMLNMLMMIFGGKGNLEKPTSTSDENRGEVR